MSEKLNKTLGIHLSKDPETEGFDLQAGESWIYPTNYPVREYQYNITQKALLNNTLVSLPTGLGKTFIAAVVMFNYFRWYPLGKVVFMAPTRPLVKQQIDACYDIMAIPKECTIEITGAKMSSAREDVWNEKRVFFITPQILQNDLDKFQSLGPKIKCLVFDEAHRARGNHAYCEVIRKLMTSNKFFRVLALSATPGGSINDILEIVQNLLISHLEFRTEESLDVSPYVFQRNLTTVVVPLGDKLQEVKDDYMRILEYYTRTLMRYKIIQGNCANLTKGKIFMLTKQYQQHNRGTSPNYAEIMKSLNICITLYHAAELLIRHGLRSFLTFFEEHIEKPLLRSNTEIRRILADVREYMGPPPQIQQLPDDDYVEISQNVKFGHPKFYKLRDILIDHFNKAESVSKVIVFFEYRESVMEAYALLIQSRPILKPRIFIGQKQGVTQRLQINVVKAFREGRCNVLLSTSIGEEGLDVGEVDLIICFDISNKSPIRMVQRMGRTGRKKDGQVTVLVTEGKEQQTLKDCLIHKNNVAFHVLGSKELSKGLNSNCPRLVPSEVVPKCEKIFVTVQKPVLKKGSTLKDMFRTLSSKSSEPSFSPDLQIIEIDEKIPQLELLSLKENPFDEDVPVSNIFNKKIEKQRSFQEIHKVEHSSRCELLVNLLQIAESRRFNIPMSQLSTTSQNKNLKQTDIRNMFFKTPSINDFVLPSTQVTIELTPPVNVEDKNFGDPEFFTELTNYLSIQIDNVKDCRLCPPQIDCGKLKFKNSSSNIFIWTELEASVYLDITLEDLKCFEKTFDVAENVSFKFDDTMDFHIPETPSKQPTQKETKILEIEDLIDSSILADFVNTTSNFQAPKSLNNLINKYSTSLIDEDLLEKNRNTEIAKEEHNSQNSSKHSENVSITNHIQHKTCGNFEKNYSNEEIKNILAFFKLDDLDSLFEVNIPESQDTVIYSPDIFDETNIVQDQSNVNGIDENSTSPILCSYVKKKRPFNVQNSTSTYTLQSQSILTSSSTPVSSKPIKSSQHNSTVTRSNSAQDCSRTLAEKKSKVQNTIPPYTLKSQSTLTYSSTPVSSKLPNSFQHSPTVIRCNSSQDCTRTLEEKKSSSVSIDDLFDFAFLELPSKKNTQSALKSEKMKSLTNDFCEELLTKSKQSGSSSRNENINKDIDISILEDFYDEELLKSPKRCDGNFSYNEKTTNVDTNEEIKDAIPDRIDFIEKNTNRKTSELQINENNPKNKLECLMNNVEFKQSGSQNKTYKIEPEIQKDLDFASLNSRVQNIKTQASITQIMSMITEPIPQSKMMQKENINQNIPDLDDDFFNFSFNTKNPVKSKYSSTDSDRSLNTILKATTFKEPYNVNQKINESNQDSSINTTLGSVSHNSSTTSEKSFKTKLKEPFNINQKLNDSGGNSSINTTLGSMSHNSSTSNEKSSKITKAFSLNTNMNNSFKSVLNGSDSDDEFESKPTSPVWIRSKPVVKKRQRSTDDSDNEFETRVTSPIFARPKIMKKSRVEAIKDNDDSNRGIRRNKANCKKIVNQFIEDEAELSICDEFNVSEDEDDIGSQEYDQSFVTDETLNDDTQMHAVYLKSVKSPRLLNRFKIPTRLKNIDVYSQLENVEEEADSDDSFVVHDETIEACQELSQLEILEKQLEIQKRRKKMPHGIKQPTKRKRIIVDSDSD